MQLLIHQIVFDWADTFKSMLLIKEEYIKQCKSQMSYSHCQRSQRSRRQKGETEWIERAWMWKDIKNRKQEGIMSCQRLSSAFMSQIRKKDFQQIRKKWQRKGQKEVDRHRERQVKTMMMTNNRLECQEISLKESQTSEVFSRSRLTQLSWIIIIIKK